MTSDDLSPDQATPALNAVPDDELTAVSPEQLDHVSALLASLPTIPMPDDVATRLDAVLSALPVPGSSTAQARHRSDRRLAWSGRALGLAAGVAAVLVVSGVVVSNLSSSGPAGDPGVLTAESADATSTAAPIELMSSGTQYSTEKLPAQLNTVLVSAETNGPRVAMTDQPTANLYARVDDEAALRACVAELAQSDTVTPIAVDLATFQTGQAAKNALIVVLPSQTNSSQVQVFVVAPDCSGPDATLLYYRVINAADLAALDDGTFVPVTPSPGVVTPTPTVSGSPSALATASAAPTTSATPSTSAE
ncbi:MAG: hypothetical protein WAN48_01275 [Actinomycetes bacterium]